MTCEEYRTKYKRCRLCKYAAKVFDGEGRNAWLCVLKNKKHRRDLLRTNVKGMFCRHYIPDMKGK